MAKQTLKPVDHVEILSIMDNTLDVLMASTPIAQRAPLLRDKFSRPQLHAEHGVSMLVTIYSEGSKDSFLFDAGTTVDGVLHNLDVLEVRPNDIHSVVLSHGHTDHTLGLVGILKRHGRAGMPIILHPDAFLNRKMVLPDDHEVDLPPPKRSDIEAEGIKVIEERGPPHSSSTREFSSPDRSLDSRPSSKDFLLIVRKLTGSGNRILGFTMTRRW